MAVSGVWLCLAAGVVQAGGDRPLATPEAKNRAIAEQLAAYYWDMEAAFDSSGGRLNDWFGDEEPVTRLIFDRAGRVHAANVCNSLDWNYSTHGSKAIRFTPSKGVTLMACRGELMLRQERMYAEMPKIRRYALGASASSTAQRLTLFLVDGGKWQFTGQATPQTRYGHLGRNIELEIALDLVPCHPGASKQCMRARQVRWDRNTKTCLGSWHLLTNGIEGYTHNPGRHEIIAVQAFPLTERPRDAPEYAYVMQWLRVSVIPSLKQLPDCVERDY
ncbi:DUF4377 domain-containing protein [Comamonas testosteroni]